MSEVQVGDEILAISSDGNLFYDPVYAFGHKAQGEVLEQ